MSLFKIRSTGTYLPNRIVSSAEIELKRGYEPGLIEKKIGVIKRHIVEDESTTQMAAWASEAALQTAGLQAKDIDCIVSACGVGSQAIPATACLIQKELGLIDSGIPAFDINSTCLSFLTALDVCSHMLSEHRYKNILIVSSDMPSIAVNQNEIGNLIFGDGAASMIISAANNSNSNKEASRILSASMETYSSGSSSCRIQAGGTNFHPTRYKNDIIPFHFFEMNGKELYRLTVKYIGHFVDGLLNKANLDIEQIDWIVPHQASHLGLKHIQNKLKFSSEKMINIFSNYGNQVAASIPMAFHEGIITNRFKRGDKILLLGTSAGLSLGGMIIEY